MNARHVIFSGQGAQQVGMGRSLYDHGGRARARYDDAADILGWDVREISFRGPEAALTETRHCQPALFVHGLAVVSVLEDRGVLAGPAASAFGLSLGELTAYCHAGVFDFETGLKLVAERGARMQEACEATEGGMAALIGGSREDASRLAEACDLDVANFNCPGQIVISGARPAIADAVGKAREFGFKMAKELNVAGAYHSRLMAPARERFAAALAPLDFRPPKIPVYTNTTGRRVEDPAAIKEALARQVTGSVYFEDNVRHAASESGCTSFLECGPGAVLAGFARRIDRSWKVVSVAGMDDIPAA